MWNVVFNGQQLGSSCYMHVKSFGGVVFTENTLYITLARPQANTLHTYMYTRHMSRTFNLMLSFYYTNEEFIWI